MMTEHEHAESFLAELDKDTVATPWLVPAVLQALAEARSETHVDEGDLLPQQAWFAAGAIAAADDALNALGADWHWKRPEDEQEAWLQQLRLGLDAFADVAWCLRFGYTFAGLATARRTFERWTFNLASSTGQKAAPGEDYADFIRRIWQVYPAVVRDRDLGQEWSELSELLHGRSIDVGGVPVSVQLALPGGDRARLHESVVSLAEVALRQVRGAIDTALTAAGKSTPFAHGSLQIPVDKFPLAAEPDFFVVMSPPLTWDFVQSGLATTVSGWGDTYRGIVASPEKDPGAVMAFAWMSVEERWARRIDESRRSFEAEQKMLGDDFAPASVATIVLFYQCVSQLAELVADEESQLGRASALHAAAAALESAWVLWLRDSDDAMICARTVLESTARARTHRVKPERGAQLELRGAATTPHRWLEAAGWSRLSSFNRALGEYCHAQESSREEGARNLLISMQRDPSDVSPPNTARARALEEVATMLAHEVVETIRTAHPNLAKEFARVTLGVSDLDAIGRDVEAWLNHGLAFKKFEFGQTLRERGEERLQHYDDTATRLG
jgi:hypothetical protein